MTDRGKAALQFLAENTDSGEEPSASNDWSSPRRTAYAFQVQDRLESLGLAKRHSHPVGAANTLAALRKRGLTAKGGDGVFIQARWWITPAGLKEYERGCR